MKRPWLAAVLNFVTIGLGYVYAGQRVLLGVLLTLGAGVLLRYDETHTAPLFTGHLSTHWIITVSGLSLTGLATAIDVYKDVREKNGG